jgi:succinoglycan biosynthesis transport protein ExoP
VEALPDQYEGSAVVAFAPHPNVAGSDPDTVRLVVPKYIAILDAYQTRREVATAIGLSVDDLSGALEASPASDSGNLDVAVTLGDPDLAALAANEYARLVVEASVDDALVTSEFVVRANAADTPSGPPRRLFEASAVVVGILLGIGVSLLIEGARPRVRSWRDIQQITGYSVVGRIPRARMLRARPEDALAHPFVGVAFRNMRTNVERLAQDRGTSLKVVVVTSPTNSEGKTTVAALFAESFARLGSRVLLVDADLRRPSVARHFKLTTRPGLSSVLKGERSLEEAAQPGWLKNLSVLTTEPDPEGGDLVATRFAAFLEDARSLYDMVVVDTPPLLGTDEGRTITTFADGVLLVVRAGTMTGSANEGGLALEALKAPVLGAVGNALRRSQVGPSYA